MPIFEYHCPDCQEDFEELRNHSERDTTIACPKCESRRAQRKVSVFASCGNSFGGSCGPTSSGGFT